MEFIGWLGVVFIFVASVSQLVKLIRTKHTRAISKWTYVYLNSGVVCYLIHAIQIRDAVFIAAQLTNLAINSTVLLLILWYRRGDK